MKMSWDLPLKYVIIYIGAWYMQLINNVQNKIIKRNCFLPG